MTASGTTPTSSPPPNLVYSIANYGKTPAIILDVQCALVISDTVPTKMQKCGFLLFNSPILQAGEVRSELR
jgi:hypothetical protein